jgi:hypothetical protein
MEFLESNFKKSQSYIDKIRYGQDKVHSTHSACKSKEREFVGMDKFKRTKERINYAFAQFNLMF